MEEVPSNMDVVIKNVSSKGIIIRDREEITDKGEEIKTTEYFLDVGEPVDGDEVDDTQFVTVQSEQDGQYVAVEVGDSGQLLIPDKEVILWNEICRVCANSGSDKEFIPIFSGEGVEHDLSSKIETYLPMRVSENDSLPLQVCYNCAATMIAWDEIFKGCMDAQQRLLELQSKLNLKEQYYNDSPVEEENMGTVLEVETTNHEEPQVSTKDSLETLQIVETNRKDSSNVKRKLCTKAKLEKPLPSFGPRKQCNKPLEPVDPLKLEPDEPGDEPSETDEPVKQIQKSSGDFTYMCGVCDELFEEEDKLMRHIREAHEESETELDPVRYECSICGRSYALKIGLIRHLARHRGITHMPGEEKRLAKAKIRLKHASGSVYKCDTCKKVLSSRKACLRHIRVHNNEKPIVCEECGKSYRIEQDLKRHQDDVHKKIKRFPCDLCEKFFAAKGTRDAHRRIHTGEKPFECDECGKFFRSVSLLGVHKRVHRDYRPHKCNSCEKAFRSKQKLEAHEAIHTGIRPYPCDICNKRFAAKGEVTRHRSVHFNDKRFLCSECGLAFRLNRYLKTHIRTHHKDKVEILLKTLTE